MESFDTSAYQLIQNGCTVHSCNNRNIGQFTDHAYKHRNGGVTVNYV
jgi:hypothetical protein